jgi:hypothetical protein
MNSIHKKFNLEKIRGISYGGLHGYFNIDINDMDLPVIFWANDPRSYLQLSII